MKRVFLILICLISFIKVSALELDNYDFYITNDEYNIEIGHDDRTSYGITVDEKQLMINEKINFKLNNVESKEFVKIIPKSFYFSPFEEEKRIYVKYYETGHNDGCVFNEMDDYYEIRCPINNEQDGYRYLEYFVKYVPNMSGEEDYIFFNLIYNNTYPIENISVNFIDYKYAQEYNITPKIYSNKTSEVLPKQFDLSNYYKSDNYFLDESINIWLDYQNAINDSDSIIDVTDIDDIDKDILFLISIPLAFLIFLLPILILVIELTKYSRKGPISEENFRMIMFNHGFKVSDITNDFPGTTIALRATKNDIEFTYYLMPFRKMELFNSNNSNKQYGSKYYIESSTAIMHNFGSSHREKNKIVDYTRLSNTALFAAYKEVDKEEVVGILKELNFYLFGNKKKKNIY